VRLPTNYVNGRKVRVSEETDVLVDDVGVERGCICPETKECSRDTRGCDRPEDDVDALGDMVALGASYRAGLRKVRVLEDVELEKSWWNEYRRHLAEGSRRISRL
jgi:hypothetical protein